jgi:AbiV family abortive infection protein
MLKDSNGHKPSAIELSEDVWKQMMKFIRDGILRKIDAVRHMQTADEDIAGGLYVYAVEEFGKLLLLRDAPSLNGKRQVKYYGEFVDHKKKINTAFEYFQKNNFHVCMMLAQGCPGQTSDVDDGNWDKVIVDRAADTEAKLLVFYADFVYDHDKNPVVESPPDVEPKMLQRATEQREEIANKLPI